MPVRDHTYYLAQENKVYGPRQDLTEFLREQFQLHAREAASEPSRLDGASVWWLGDERHVAVTFRAPDSDRSATVIVEPVSTPAESAAT
jgi:hypothetical protein